MENNEIKERKVLVYKDNGDKKIRFTVKSENFSDILDVIKKEFNMSDNDIKNYEFIDGMHRTRYSANSILPESSVHPRTGQRTTDLSIFMVRAKKNIESGSKPVCTFARVDKKVVGQEIKMNNLNKDVVEYCGLNLSQARGESMLVVLAASIGIKNIKCQYQIIDNAAFEKEIKRFKEIKGISSEDACNNHTTGNKEDEKGCKVEEKPEIEEDKKPNEIKGESEDNTSNEGASNSGSKEKPNIVCEINEDSIVEYFKSLDDEKALELINRINNEKFGHIVTDSDMMEMMRHL